MTPIRVVVADDQTTVREGLVALLALLPGIDVVAQAHNGSSALAAVDAHRPDVVLLDLRMPDMDGISITTELAATHPDTAVVILTSYGDDASILESLDAGARGYLTKHASHTEIRQAIAAAATGLTTLESTVHQRLTRAVRLGRPAADLPGGLTRREAEVLALIGAGLTNRAIARRLRIETATVKSHINRIFAKTGVADRAAATAYARAYGLVP